MFRATSRLSRHLAPHCDQSLTLNVIRVYLYSLWFFFKKTKMKFLDTDVNVLELIDANAHEVNILH